MHPTPASASIGVRPMRLSDLPSVMAIDRQSFPRPWPLEAWLSELQNTAAHFVVACAGAPPAPHSWLRRWLARSRQSNMPVVGFAGMWMMTDEAHIATIAVDPAWRRRGVGEQMLRELLRQATARHATTVTLEVRVSNVGAQALYRKYGFEVVGQRKAYYQDNREDALIMTITRFTDPSYQEQLGLSARADAPRSLGMSASDHSSDAESAINNCAL